MVDRFETGLNATDAEFRQRLAQDWGWVALRGVAAIIFGILAFVWPFATVWALALVWGAFVLVDGVGALATGWNLYKRGVRWWPYLLFGIVGILAGIITFAWPGMTALILLYIIAFWAILGGIFQIVAAIRLRKEIEGEWLLVLAGVVSVLFGALLLMNPLTGALALVWVIGAFAIASGVLSLILAFKLRGYNNSEPLATV